MMKIGIMKSKNNAKYVEKRFVIIKNRKRDLNYTKMLEIIVIYWTFRGTAHSICNLQYKVPREIPVKIHNGSKYDYHFIIKKLVEEFRGEEF